MTSGGGYLETLKPIRDALLAGRPKLVVLVGAGVSLGATRQERASWKGLMHHGVDYLVQSGETDDPALAEAEHELINRRAFSPQHGFDLTEALARSDSIISSFGEPDGQAFARWLEDGIGSLGRSVVDDTVLSALCELRDAGALFMTTNYDDVLCDALQLPPVAWDDHEKCLEVINGEHEGVLHIHGHWKKGSSVVFGRAAYKRLVGSDTFQTILRMLWMNWKWLCVGCGAGLRDPNLGGLFEWGETEFGHGRCETYFLVREEEARSLIEAGGEGNSQVMVPFGEFSELPNLLRAIAPEPWCLAELGPDYELLRRPEESPLANVLPSWTELLNNDVPALEIDDDVYNRLHERRWAIVYDTSSVGKTTLAQRLAARVVRTGGRAYYQDLGEIDERDEELLWHLRLDMRRRSRPGNMIILDNAHLLPRVAQKLRDRWAREPQGSTLLILATVTQKTAAGATQGALTRLVGSAGDSPIRIALAESDLLAVARYVVRRIAPAASALTLDPPESALRAWGRQFGRTLGAFVSAVTHRHTELRAGQWDLPPSASAAWMRERHIDALTQSELENLAALATVAAQPFECDLRSEALSYPGLVDRMLKASSLLRRVERGTSKRVWYGLREKGQAELVLAALHPRPEMEKTLAGIVRRCAFQGLALTRKLSATSQGDLLEKIWDAIDAASRDPNFGDQVLKGGFLETLHLAESATAARREDIPNLCLAALQANRQRAREMLFDVPTSSLPGLLEDTPDGGGGRRFVALAWGLINEDPQRSARLALEASPGFPRAIVRQALKHCSASDVVRFQLAIDRARAERRESSLRTTAGLLGRCLGHRTTALSDIELVCVTLDEQPDVRELLGPQVLDLSFQHFGHLLRNLRGDTGRDLIADISFEEWSRHWTSTTELGGGR